MPFEGFDHVDLRIASLRDAEPFYDRLLPELGLPRKIYIFIDRSPDGDDWSEVSHDERYNALEFHEERKPGSISRFVSLVDAPGMLPVDTRVAFRLGSAALLEEWEGRLWSLGASNIERSEEMETYPALFFEDPCGTKLELCARRPAS